MIKKKLVSLAMVVCTFVYTFSSFTFPAEAGDGKDDITMLNAFGLCTDKKADDVITRADMVRTIADMYFPEYNINQESTVFSDVPKSHWASGYIKQAYEAGIIRGYDERFYPDYNITVLDAACILLNAAGHSVNAEYNGDYTQGYIKLAAKYKLLSNIKKSYNDELTYADLEKIFVKYLEMPFGKIEWKNSTAVYTTDSSETVLSEVFEAEKIKGRIIGNEKTLLVSPRDKAEPVITINGIDYIDEQRMFQQYLGYNVTAYVKEDEDSDWYILYANPLDTNVCVTSNLEDVYVDEEYVFIDMPDGREKKLNLSKRADLIFNGVTLIPWEIDMLEDLKGSATFLDNDNDGKYDVIFVDAYENYFVDSAGSITYTITDKLGKEPIVLDPDDDKLFYTIKQFGIDVRIGDIKEYSILTVRKTANISGIRYIDIEVSEDFVKGTVKGRDSEWIKVGNQTYRYDKELSDALSVITEGKFYMDIYGNIAGVSDLMNSDAAKEYSGVFYKAIYDDTDDTITVCIVDLSGKVQKLKTTEKVRYIKGSENKRIEATKLFDDIQFSHDNGFTVQLIQYKTNADGLIDTITAAVDCSNGIVGGAGRDIKNFSLDIRMNDSYIRAQGGQRLYTSASDALPKMCYLSSKTSMLILPRSIMEGTVLEEDVLVKTGTQFSDRKDHGYADGKFYSSDGLVYDCGETNVASVILLFKDDTRDYVKNAVWSSDTDCFIVSKAETVINEADEITCSLIGSRGKSRELKVEATGKFGYEDCKNVKDGDILRWYGNHGLGKLYWAQRVFTLSDDDNEDILHLSDRKKSLNFNTSSTEDTSYAIGEIVASDDMSVMIDANYSNGYRTYFPQSWTNIVIMDITGKNIVLKDGTMKDLTPGVTVFCNAKEHQLRDIVIIKED